MSDWKAGSPERAAADRFSGGTATVDDLLLLASTEAQQAVEALPPVAVAPMANNMGEVILADPSHASACAFRARSFVEEARRRLASPVSRKENEGT
jgi:hypothetical protein